MQIKLKKYQACFKYLICFAVVYLLILTINLNYKIIIIEGDSMNPALRSGQIVLVQKNIENLKKNDIIVFKQEGLMIKRILGLPADRIVLSDSGLSINKVYIRPYTYEGDEMEYILAADEYFVVGDNYMMSFDSRHFGPVHDSDIVGKVIWIL